MNKIFKEVNGYKDLNEGFVSFQKFAIEHTGKPMVMKIEEVARPRNYKFHGKLFSLIKFAYLNTELAQAEHRGEIITQSKSRFRKDLIIESGFYEVDVMHDGSKRKVAHSISYEKCTQSKAEKIYNAMLDVVAYKLGGCGYDRETLEKLSNEWEGYT